MTAPNQLPNDIDALKAMIIASEERNARKDVRIERLEKLLTDFKRALFGAKSEKGVRAAKVGRSSQTESSAPIRFRSRRECRECGLRSRHGQGRSMSGKGRPRG